MPESCVICLCYKLQYKAQIKHSILISLNITVSPTAGQIQWKIKTNSQYESTRTKWHPTIVGLDLTPRSLQQCHVESGRSSTFILWLTGKS